MPQNGWSYQSRFTQKLSFSIVSRCSHVWCRCSAVIRCFSTALIGAFGSLLFTQYLLPRRSAVVWLSVEVIHLRLHPNDINRDSGIEIPEAWMPTIKKHNNRRAVWQLSYSNCINLFLYLYIVFSVHRLSGHWSHILGLTNLSKGLSYTILLMSQISWALLAFHGSGTNQGEQK